MDARRAMALRALQDIRATPVVPYGEGRPVRRVVRVRGRRTGLPRPFGINVTRVGGGLYVCAPTRRRDWVRNLLSAGRCAVERDGPDGADAPYTATLVEGREAARALATYVPLTGYAGPELPFALDASLEEILPHTAATAVFRLDPVAEAENTPR